MTKRIKSAHPCPICGSCEGKKNTEHLPFKALYQYDRIGDEGQDQAATIRICEKCNTYKSIYDQEILALYGGLICATSALKAASSLRKVSECKTLDDVALLASRVSTCNQTVPIMYAGGIPATIECQWLSMVAKGVYYFFKREPFTGMVNPMPKLLNMNVSRNDFKMESSISIIHLHKINSVCSIVLDERKSQSHAASVFLYPPNNNSILAFTCFMHRNMEDGNSFYGSKPKVFEDVRPLRFVNPRQIYDFINTDHGITYNGGVIKH